MSAFDDVKVGDWIVIREGRPGFGRDLRPYLIEQVTKVTTTQITAGGIRFTKRSGFEYGKESRSARYIEIVSQYGKPDRLMTVEEAEIKNREIEQELRHSALVSAIIDKATRSNLKELPYESLLEIARILEIEVR